MSFRYPVLALSLMACKPAEEAPVSLADASMYLFSGFEDDAAEMAAVLLDLEAAMAQEDIETPEPKDRSYSLDKLTSDKLGGVTAPPGTDPSAQIATVVLGRSDHTYDDNEALALEPNQVCIESNTTVFYGRTFTTDTACFEAGTCEFLRTTNEVRKENLLAKAWYDLFKDYRTIDLGDGRTAMIARSWIEEVFEGDGGSTSFDQNFTAEAWIPDGTGTLRAYAMWAELNLGLGDDVLQNIIIDGIDEGMQNADNFIDGDTTTTCKADRSRAYDRP